MRGSYSFLMLLIVALLAYLIGAKFPNTGTTVLAKVGL
jgi:hypothetical protein